MCVLVYICWLCKQEWDCSTSSVLMQVSRAARNGSYQVILLCFLLSLSICPHATFPPSKSHLYCIRPRKITVLLVLCENLTGASGAVSGVYEDQTSVLKNNAVLVLHHAPKHIQLPRIHLNTPCFQAPTESASTKPCSTFKYKNFTKFHVFPACCVLVYEIFCLILLRFQLPKINSESGSEYHNRMVKIEVTVASLSNHLQEKVPV